VALTCVSPVQPSSAYRKCVSRQEIQASSAVKLTCRSSLSARSVRVLVLAASWAAFTQSQPTTAPCDCFAAIAPGTYCDTSALSIQALRARCCPRRPSPCIAPSPLASCGLDQSFLRPPHTSLSACTLRDRTPLSIALSFSNASSRPVGRCFPARWCVASAPLPR
jgi:hypothetical protein